MPFEFAISEGFIFCYLSGKRNAGVFCPAGNAELVGVFLRGVSMRKIRQGDDVVVITGKDKGKRGTVLRIMENDRLVVENVNMAKKHQKPNPQRGEPGGIVDKEMPLHLSNVALYNPETGGADRVGIKILEDGRKVRVFKSNGEVVDV
jgi:large subunit ribosomal protein L24